MQCSILRVTKVTESWLQVPNVKFIETSPMYLHCLFTYEVDLEVLWYSPRHFSAGTEKQLQLLFRTTQGLLFKIK